MREVWTERQVGNLKMIERHTVRSRKRKSFHQLVDEYYLTALYWMGILVAVYGLYGLITK